MDTSSVRRRSSSRASECLLDPDLEFVREHGLHREVVARNSAVVVRGASSRALAADPGPPPKAFKIELLRLLPECPLPLPTCTPSGLQ